MNLRVTVSGEDKRQEPRIRSESEPEEGVGSLWSLKSVVVDAKPSDLHLTRLKFR